MLDVTGAFTRPPVIQDDDAFISGGPELDRALASLDLELRPVPDRRPRRLWRAMGWGVTLTLVLLGLVQAVHLLLIALETFAPGSTPR